MTTLIALVGERTRNVTSRIDAANVSVQGARGGEEPIYERWRQATRRGSVYTLFDADPLEQVVEAWRRRLLGEGDELELAIGLVPDLPSPDFYLVDTGVGDPLIHWYAGNLADLAPARVILVEMRPRAILERIGSLPSGPELPPLRGLAASAREYIPVPGLAQPLTTPSGSSRATGAASLASSQAETTWSTSL